MNQQQVNSESIILGGGCFWCTEAVYRNIDGIIDVVPGYSGGDVENPSYKDVCSGETGHAEVIKVTFNPKLIQLDKILDVFFAVHDPTTLNRQGADVGTQYRSVIFYNIDLQKEIINEKIKSLNEKKIFKNKIVTQVLPQTNFYKAEDYHLNYYARNRNQSYCRFVIDPKIEKLFNYFPEYIKK